MLKSTYLEKDIVETSCCSPFFLRFGAGGLDWIFSQKNQAIKGPNLMAQNSKKCEKFEIPAISGKLNFSDCLSGTHADDAHELQLLRNGE